MTAPMEAATAAGSVFPPANGFLNRVRSDLFARLFLYVCVRGTQAQRRAADCWRQSAAIVTRI